MSFEWEKGFGDVRKMRARGRKAAQARGLQPALHGAGYQRVHLDQGSVWAEPGMDISRMSVSVNAAAIVRLIEPELTRLWPAPSRKYSRPQARPTRGNPRLPP